MSTVRLRDKIVGDGHPCFVIAEIGINHNGSIELAKRLVNVAVLAGCDAVKFQKRTPELCVPTARRGTMRETPWGYISYMEYRERVEFELDEFRELDEFCRNQGIMWFASCWDEPSVDFIAQFDVPCYKVASASMNDESLLRHTRSKGRPIIASTGMCGLAEVDKAVEVLGKDDLVLLHSVSTYPASYPDLNLRAIATLKGRYGVPVG